jgi:hypothetical protein
MVENSPQRFAARQRDPAISVLLRFSPRYVDKEPSQRVPWVSSCLPEREPCARRRNKNETGFVDRSQLDQPHEGQISGLRHSHDHPVEPPILFGYRS